MTGRRAFLRGIAAGAVAGEFALKIAKANQSAKAKLKVGQIGVGHAHASKLGVFRKSPEYEVIGIVEPDGELRRRAEGQEAFRDLKWMTQEQLLNVPDLQLVLVETRVRDLLGAAEACVGAGKHVHLDKPAGESLPQYKRILDSASRQKLLVQMGYMYRYNPAIVQMREFLKKGWLGELFEVHAVMSKVVPTPDRKRLAEYPGGIMFELGCHLIDLVVGLLGKPAAVSPVVQHVSPLDDDLKDNMLATLTYERSIATVKSSAMEVDGFERRHLVACGSEGTFHIQPLDNPQSRVALSKPRGTFRKGYQDIPYPNYVRYVDDAADIARVIRGEKESDFSYEHDLAVQETLLRASGLPVE